MLLTYNRGMYPLTDTDRERFWRSFEKSDGCWEWTASKWTAGYGRFFVGGRRVAAHRVSYEIHVGPIPEGLQLDHLCRNHGCVNPYHLEPVTPGENQRRGYLAGRAKPGVPKGTVIGGALKHLNKTHCPYGHPYDGDNLYVDPKRGHRHCKTCRKMRQQGGGLP